MNLNDMPDDEINPAPAASDPAEPPDNNFCGGSLVQAYSGMRRPLPEPSSTHTSSPTTAYPATVVEDELPSISVSHMSTSTFLASPSPPPLVSTPSGANARDDWRAGMHRFVGDADNQGGASPSLERTWTSEIPQERTVVPSFFGSKILLQVCLQLWLAAKAKRYPDSL